MGDDLWSDDDDEGVEAASSNGGGGGGSSAAAAGAARRATGSGAFDDDGDDCSAHGVKRPRRPSASLVSQLDRSLKDASEDSLRACLGQIAASDEALAERALHILEA